VLFDSPKLASQPEGGLRRGFLALMAVVLVGTAGYMYIGHAPFGDAIYQVVITLSTVGYTEVIDSRAYPGVRYWTIMVIVFGIASVGYIVSSLVAVIAEGQLREVMGRRRVTRQIEHLSEHHIICGYGRIGALVCQSLTDQRVPYVVIETRFEATAEAGERGFLYVQGDATEEDVLLAAGIERAKGLVTALPSDADNVFITLTARQLNPSLIIVARAEQASTHKKLEMAGATRIVSPHSIGAQRITNLLIRPEVVDLIQGIAGGPGDKQLEVDQLTVPDGSPLVGQSIREADIRNRVGLIVVGIRRSDGQMLFNPDASTTIQAGDRLVIIGQENQVDQFQRIYHV